MSLLTDASISIQFLYMLEVKIKFLLRLTAYKSSSSTFWSILQSCKVTAALSLESPTVMKVTGVLLLLAGMYVCPCVNMITKRMF